ncbi:hypothetical protein FPH17_09925 [Corynebacterium godavarianum]|uniref:Uncharacterized protein n=1 Tax=Corynebacterium godavarianum TaxID=2054421 RepID=A0ABY3DZC6_9CORY|nr:hypothetical protein [Corynebacterium godavarianum]MBL7285156.1 hypothetical protein [Corynebacterium godavarianum]TSJ72049.1 hypothetical protein FPH17_09925 [Corynebacterium godavarianum]
MQSLSEMRTERRQGTLEIDGITIEGDIEVSLEPHTEYIVNLEFEVRQETAPTAMRLRTYSAEFVLFDNETENSIRLTDGVSNSASFRLRTGQKSDWLSVFNEYLHSYKEGVEPGYECMTGDSGIVITKREGDTIHFACNNRSPREQLAFEDVTGTLTVTKVGSAKDHSIAPAEDGSPIQQYCFIDSGDEAPKENKLIEIATALSDKTSPTSEAVTTLIDRLEGLDYTIVASTDNAVTIEVDISNEDTTEFAMVDEARLWNLNLVKVRTHTLLNQSKNQPEN